MSFAKQIRIQLVTMKYNAIRVVARKCLKHLYLVRGTKMTLQVRILGKLYTVLLRHEYTPKTDELQTISDYRSKVFAKCEQLVKLSHVADLALMFEDKIRWHVFKRLLVHDTQLQMSLDFYREAFTYGLKLRRVFTPWEPDDPAFMRIWRKAFWSEDCRLVTLSAGSHEMTFRFPEKSQRWFRKLLKCDECLFRPSVLRRGGRRLDLHNGGGAIV